jgi:hypothetical protein
MAVLALSGVDFPLNVDTYFFAANLCFSVFGIAVSLGLYCLEYVLAREALGIEVKEKNMD